MNIKTKAIMSAAFVALLAASLSAPASARIDGDEGGLSAYAHFGKERGQVQNGDFGRTPDRLINRPKQR